MTSLVAKEKNDPLIDLAENGLFCLGEAQRFYLVNVLPFRKYILAITV